MLQLSKWHHKWRRSYHLCYKANIVFNRNNKFTWNNSICEKNVEIMDTNVKTIISEQKFEEHNTKKKKVGNRYEQEVALEDKVYQEMYYSH